MSYADFLFHNNCEYILEGGCETPNRAVWPDGTPSMIMKADAFVNRYDLSEEFPLYTVRKTGLKSAMDEILWIYQKKSNNVNDLNSHIWDSWADENGSIGKAYGYQVGKVDPRFPITRDNHSAVSTRLIGLKDEYPSVIINNDGYVEMDQMDYVIYLLKNDPFSRRIMISLWDVAELAEMNLEPCCWSINFCVTVNRDGDKVLNATLNQRSADMLAANNWNVCQYALLVMMLAQVADMKVGHLTHVITNPHIYDRHIPIVKELLTRETFAAPKISLNKHSNFYDYTTDDLIFETEYKVGGPQVHFDVAI